ncbi:MAG: hypothetical protein WC554_17995, partial [Clostridia bacterium]
LQIIKERKDHDVMIHRLCEGAGKGRGAKAGGLQKLQTWRNCTLSTGEMPITNATSGGGAINRVIEIDCKGIKLFQDGHDTVLRLSKNYGHAGRKFIEEIMNQNLFVTINDIQSSFYDQLASGKSTEKQAQAASMILTADTLAEMLIFHDGLSLTMDDIRPYLVTKDRMDVNRRAYEWIADLVASNPQRFQKNQYSEYSGECWGEVVGDSVYIIKSVFDRVLKEAGFNGDSFLSWAKRAEKIEYNEGRNTKMRRLTGVGTPARCVCVKLPDEFDEQIELNGDFE